jgi:hypothetical protein
MQFFLQAFQEFGLVERERDGLLDSGLAVRAGQEAAGAL